MASSRQNKFDTKQQLINHTYLTRTSSELNELRKEGRFCDVTITAGDDRFQAHKVVLSCATSYFRNMFACHWKENEENEVEVPGIGEFFEPILDFAYTGKFYVSLNTVVGILGLACYMGFTEVMQECADFLISLTDSFSIDDCLKIWFHAKDHDLLSDLAQCYHKHLMKNFIKCIESELCLESVPVDFILKGLCDEEIETDSCTEEQILQVTIKWVRHKWEDRQCYTVDILKKIRLGLIPGDRLKEILGDEILAKPGCEEMMEEVVKLQATMEEAVVPLMISHPALFATRNTIKALIYTDEVEDSALFIECTTNTGCFKLTQLADIPNKCPYHSQEDEEYYDHGFRAFVTDTGHLYVAGANGNPPTDDPEEEAEHMKWVSENNFFKYDWDKNEWIVLPPMPSIQSLPILLQLDDYIYSIAYMECDIIPTQIIQRFSLSHQTWERISGHKLNLVVQSAAVIGGYILFLGFLQQFVLYKPEQNKWFEMSGSVHETVRYITERSYKRQYLLVHKGICYFVHIPKYIEGDVCDIKVIRLACNFNNNEPTVTFAERVDEMETFGTYAGYLNLPLFTFDKRKLGMTRTACECKSHPALPMGVLE
ncbi:kelch-like protein 32 isoform X2 [Amphiura filiformis]|uniref:kelch-like protein 32 isoform X2 n=1 Tax=Amphiura filiformis TaxID=82378 RepID=UPI003B21105A